MESLSPKPTVGLIALKQQAYAEIEARFACAHLDRQLRARTTADGRQTFVTQCIRCGHTSQPIARKKAEALSGGKPFPHYDDNLDGQWRERKSAEYRQIFQALAPSLAAEYEAYLCSTEWRERRKAVLARASDRCELCQKADATQVHHRTYIRLGSELPTDLLAVCENCHEILHAQTSA